MNDRLSRELSDKSLEVEHLELFNQSLVSELEAHKRRTTTLLQDQTNVSRLLVLARPPHDMTFELCGRFTLGTTGLVCTLLYVCKFRR